MKDKIIIVLAVCMTMCIFSMDYFYEQMHKQKALAKELENTVSYMGAKADTEILRLNDSLQLYMGRISDLKMTKSNIEAKYGELLKASNVKVKYVDRVVSVSTETSGHDTITCLVDSFGGLRTAYMDDFTHIIVDIDSARKATIDYSVKDSLTVINYTKRHKLLFGLIKWNSFEGTEVISHNPKSRPTAIQSIQTINK